jgi:hypothetical protein
MFSANTKAHVSTDVANLIGLLTVESYEPIPLCPLAPTFRGESDARLRSRTTRLSDSNQQKA